MASPAPGRFTPGTLVRLADRPDWGTGQVQSAIGNRVTVMFEHAGKQLVLADKVSLLPASSSPRR